MSTNNSSNNNANRLRALSSSLSIQEFIYLGLQLFEYHTRSLRVMIQCVTHFRSIFVSYLHLNTNSRIILFFWCNMWSRLILVLGWVYPLATNSLGLLPCSFIRFFSSTSPQAHTYTTLLAFIQFTKYQRNEQIILSKACDTINKHKQIIIETGVHFNEHGNTLVHVCESNTEAQNSAAKNIQCKQKKRRM